MKKIISLCLLSLFFLSLISAPLFAQEVADILILEKMIEAKGGREVLESIKDTTVTGLLHPFAFPLIGVPIRDILSIAVKIYHKEPNKFREDLEANGKMFTAQAFDGEAAWMIDSQIGIFKEPPESERENLKKLAYFHGNSYLLYPEKYGITYTYRDKKNIEEEAGIFKNLRDKLGIKDYFVLEQTFPNGNKNYLYVDFKTHLVYIILDQMGPKVEWVMVFYDYKEVDGVMFAYSMSWAFGEAAATFTFTEVIFNSGLEDSLFKMSK
jgi:outer membrane lipoprotein-sorting protein